VCLVNSLVKTKTVGDLLVGRVPQHQLAAADHHGYFTGGDMENIQEVLDVRIPFEVYVGVRIAVAHQELFDLKRTGGMGRTDEHSISHPGRHQLNPAEKESTHDDLAEFGIGLHQRQHLLVIKFDHLTRLGDTHSEESPPAREHVDFARELTRPMDSDKGLSGT